MSEQEHTEDSVDSEGEEKGPKMSGFDTCPAYLTTIVRRQILQEMVKNLPEQAQKNVKALKNVQLEHLKLEAKFFQEVYQLEKKYHVLYQPLLDKRKDIIIGAYVPTEAESKWEDPEEEDEEVAAKLKKISLEINKHKPPTKYSDDLKGIPDFWLTVFKNTELLADMIQDHDEPILKKLTDITVTYLDNPMSYILTFHFDSNEYFTDSVLTKQYYLRSTVEENEPFAFEGPEIHKCTGCVINWNKGKNLTVKTIKKKQKHKARGAVRTVVKQVPNDSFFNFFTPPEVPDDKTEMNYESETILGTDFEIGHFLRARVIPKAVLFYTGDIIDDDDEDDEEEEEEEEEESENEETEEDEVQHKGKDKKKGGKQQNPNECQQQ